MLISLLARCIVSYLITIITTPLLKQLEGNEVSGSVDGAMGGVSGSVGGATGGVSGSVGGATGGVSGSRWSYGCSPSALHRGVFVVLIVELKAVVQQEENRKLADSRLKEAQVTVAILWRSLVFILPPPHPCFPGNQYTVLARKFRDIMSQYNIIQEDYRDRCKERIKRQLKISECRRRCLIACHITGCGKHRRVGGEGGKGLLAIAAVEFLVF